MSIPSSVSIVANLIVKIRDRFDDTISALEDIAAAVCNINQYPSASLTPLAFQSKTYMESYGPLEDDFTILEDYMEQRQDNPLGFVVKVKNRIKKGSAINATTQVPSFSSSRLSSNRHSSKISEGGI
jgi:hypothetical protein